MSRRELKKQETRSLLLKVGRAMFNQNEFDQVTVDDLAAEAGISRKTFFNYYQGKGQLLKAVVVDWMEQNNVWALEEAIGEDIESVLIPPNIDQVVNWVLDNRRLFKMVLRQTDFFEVRVGDFYKQLQGVSSESYRPRLKRVIDAQAAGVIRKDISAELICHIYDALRLDAVRFWLQKPDDEASAKDFHEYYDAAKIVLFKGLMPD